MRAILVKNANFETIGFEVKSNGLTIYSWGIASELKSNWQKEINVNDWMPQICKLIELQGILQVRNNATRDFFEVAEMNGLLKAGQAIKIKFYEELLNRTTQTIENIIKNIN
jgi:hypothetical protein